MENDDKQRSATEAAGYIAGVGLGMTRSVLPGSTPGTVRAIISASLFVCWAMLLSARTIAAMIYANAPAGGYEMGLVHLGWWIPVSAWFCFAAAIVLLICAMRCRQ